MTDPVISEESRTAAADVLLALFDTAPASAYEAATLAVGMLEQVLGTAAWRVYTADGARWQQLAGATGRGAPASEPVADGVSVEPAHLAERLGPAELRALLRWLRLICERDRYRVELDATTAEAMSQSVVAEEILTIRDLDQVLLSVVNHTLVLLESDICGVLLRDGDVIEMTACVGHRVIETAHLRMHRGQGLAGLVFESGRLGRVDSYAEDRTISPDYVPLAAQEGTKSALAVPLVVDGELTGVLEVWRRRDSVFTEADVRRMLGLAALASVAIENARLYDLQAVTLTRLSAAHQAMEHQVTLLDRSARLQSALLRTVIDHTGSTFAHIMRTVAEEYECTAVFVRENGLAEASYPPLDATALAALPLTAHRPRSARSATAKTLADGRRLWTQAVVVGDQEIGTVNLIGGAESDEAMATAASQVAMACALARLEQRAASQARNTAFEQIVWDLVSGPPEHRSAALSRAGELGLTLHGGHRIVRGGFDNLGELARSGGWDTGHTEAARRAVLRAVRSTDPESRLRLASMRGDWIVGVLAVPDAAAAREAILAMNAAAAAALPGVRLTWGASGVYEDPLAFTDAHREAAAALDGARRLGVGECSLYDELGIVRILLGGTEGGADLQRFVDDVTGPLRDYDARHDGALIKTLRAYFDNDCSQRRAAEALFIHPKTLSYRLGQIADLSGLDLTAHSDRMRADLALRMLLLTESTDSTPADR